MMRKITCHPALDVAVFRYPEVACKLPNQRNFWLCIRLDKAQHEFLRVASSAPPKGPLGLGELSDRQSWCQNQVSLKTI